MDAVAVFNTGSSFFFMKKKKALKFSRLCQSEPRAVGFAGVYDERSRVFFQTLLNLSSSYKQTLPAFNKITSLCDSRMSEAEGRDLFQC